MTGDISFDRIMEDINYGLSGNAEHDLAYLKMQMELYQGHPLGREVIRACARKLYKLLPPGQQAEIDHLVSVHSGISDNTLDEARFNLLDGNPRRAEAIMLPLVERYLALDEAGWNAEDHESIYLCFGSPLEEAAYIAHDASGRQVRHATEPFGSAYAQYAEVLEALAEPEKASVFLGRALRWAPASVRVHFALAANFERLGDMHGFQIAVCKAYPYITCAHDLACYYHALGRYHMAQGAYGLAASFMVASLSFEDAPEPYASIMKIKSEGGGDYTALDASSAFDELDHAAMPIGADEDTLRAIALLADVSERRGDTDTAAEALQCLIGLAGNGGYSDWAERKEEGQAM